MASTTNDSTVNATPGETAAAIKAAHSGSFMSRLTTGTGAFDLVGRRRYYYMFSTVLVVGSILLMLLRGFHLGTDFAGGTTLTFVPSAGAASVSNSQVTEVLDRATGGGNVEAVQTLSGKTIVATLKALTEQEVVAGKSALNTAFTPVGGVSASDVSSTWGAQISNRAILAVIIFLVLVGIFIWIRYEKRVAVGAVLSTLHDVVVTAGIYALAGFEVTPATVIGLLTILGFSLYDTVVVYDKVQENAKGMTSLLRRTYPETANLALNQTIMRSLNTSLIALLPVAGLLVAGIAVLGGGTLKDLALVLLVGMLVGAYSSLFVAVPIAVDLKIREPAIRAHTARVLAKRKADGIMVDADGDLVGHKYLPGNEPVRRPASSTRAAGSTPVFAAASGLKPGAAPKPGARPQRVGRPAAGKPLTTKPVVPYARGLKPPAATPVAVTEPVIDQATATEPSSVADSGSARVGSSPIASGPIASGPIASGTRTPARAPAAKPGRPAGKAARPTGKRGR
jgi:preprotein translocase subunit SecF